MSVARLEKRPRAFDDASHPSLVETKFIAVSSSRIRRPEPTPPRAVRSCWGSQERHTKTVEFFLDNGVPLDDIYDTCMEMTKNEGTRALLKERKKGKGDEL